MGHATIIIVGTGTTRAEAEGDMREKFFFDYGHGGGSTYISEIISAERLDDIPPKKWVGTTRPALTWRFGRQYVVQVQTLVEQPDVDAPRETWLQQWKFTIDYHS